ncbi:MAG: hypothetical protein ACI8UO_002341 [Verrucomicrobiales bacterium]
MAASCCWQTAHAQLPTEPVQGYVYVEPFEVRNEVAFYLSSVKGWEDAEQRGNLSPEDQQKLLTQFRAQLDSANPLIIDDEPAELKFDRLLFVKVIPDLGVFPDEREEIPASEALIAAVYAQSRDGFPKRIDLRWNFFPGAQETIPVTLVVQGKRKTYDLSPGQPVQSWLIPEGGVEPQLLDASIDADIETIRIPVIGFLLLAAAIFAGLLARFLKEDKPIALCGLVAVVGMLGSFTLWGFGQLNHEIRTLKLEIPSEDESAEIVNTLLLNIYHGFNFRDEEKIYDTLAYSVVKGETLEQLYFEMRKSLELEGQGGPRVKIKTLQIRDCFPDPGGLGDDRPGFRADTEWVARGSVTHWGHTHERIKLYRAWIAVEPVDERWKVSELEVFEENQM